MFLLQLGLSSTVLLSLGNNKTNVSTHADKSNKFPCGTKKYILSYHVMGHYGKSCKHENKFRHG